MVAVRVYDTQADSWRVTRARVYRAAAAGGQVAAVRVYRVAAAEMSSAAVRVHRVAAAAGGPVVAERDRIDAQPGDTVTLKANAGTWTQLSGATVTLVGSGAEVTFRAPVLLDPATLRFQASDGSTSDTTDVAVAAGATFARVGGQWVGRQVYSRVEGSWQ